MTDSGQMILRKGTMLYHIRPKIEKEWIVLAFHPAEGYRSSADFVSPVELLRDVRLDFRIRNIRHMRLFATPESEARPPCDDGWITSVDNQGKVRICVRNDPAVLRVVGYQPVSWSWTNGTPKKWGTVYPIGTVSHPATLRLPHSFKHKIEDYNSDIERDDPEGTAFYIVLKNAEIIYH